jgi:Methyltransferase domain
VIPSPSKLASSPTKIGEYLAAGLPVISTAGIGDVDEQLADAGVILRELSADGYREAAHRLALLIGDAATRERCVEIAERQLSLDRVGIPAYEALYAYLASAGDTRQDKKAFPAISDARNVVASWRYAGLRYTDPICGHHFRRLATGSSGEPNSVCPRCWSAERHRLLWLFLNRETSLLRDRLRVLHFAPERGISRRLWQQRNLSYVTADIAPGRAAVTADLTNLPFANGRFDVVLCSHVLEHIGDDRAAIAELHRVLRPGGWAALQHPIDPDRAVTYEDPSVTTPEDRDREFFQSDHVRVYGRDIYERLREPGFDVEVVRYIDRISRSERDRYRLDQVPSPRPERDLEADTIYLCRVPSPGTVATEA